MKSKLESLQELIAGTIKYDESSKELNNKSLHLTTGVVIEREH